MILSSLRRLSSWTLGGATVAAVIFLAACHPGVTDPKDPKFIVAEKGDWKITRGELDKAVASFLHSNQVDAAQVGPSKMPLVETSMLDDLVLKKLILDQAKTLTLTDVDKDTTEALERLKTHYPTDAQYQQGLKDAGITEDQLKESVRERVIIRKVMEQEAFKNVEPSEAEVDALYLAHKSEFVTPEEIRASRVLVLVDAKASDADKAKKKKIIDAARARVEGGEDFSKVASEVSEDQYSKPRGGDIGFFRKGENEPGFDEVAFTAKPGVLSPVFTTSLGYQFLKVTQVQPGGPVPVAEARSFLTDEIKKHKEAEAAQAYAKQLLQNSGVTYHLVRVPLPGETNDASATPPTADAGTNPAPAGQ
jgi:parvulin-like peptidyl-prolyl isomerase